MVVRLATALALATTVATSTIAIALVSTLAESLLDLSEMLYFFFEFYMVIFLSSLRIQTSRI